MREHREHLRSRGEGRDDAGAQNHNGEDDRIEQVERRGDEEYEEVAHRDGNPALLDVGGDDEHSHRGRDDGVKDALDQPYYLGIVVFPDEIEDDHRDGGARKQNEGDKIYVTLAKMKIKQAVRMTSLVLL